MSEEQIKGGYILVARSMLETEIMRKPHLYFKLFLWMLLQASYKDHGNLKRGQLFASVGRMRNAMTYYAGYRPERPSAKQIRTVMKFLLERQMIVTTTVTSGMIITIRNYDYYQTAANYEGQCGGQDERSTRGEILTRKETRKKEIPPEIMSLRKRYSDQGLIDQAFSAIRSTRKSGKVADSVLLSQLQRWAKYPVAQVEAGLRVYLDKDYASQGKNENYLMGIIRNHETESPKPYNQSSGSPLLDSYYAKCN